MEPEIPVQVEEDCLILACSFTPRLVRVCRYTKELSTEADSTSSLPTSGKVQHQKRVYCRAIVPATLNVQDRCPSCKQKGTISSRYSTVWFRETCRTPVQTTQGDEIEIEPEQLVDLLTQAKKHFNAQGWRWRVIQVRCRVHQNVPNWSEVHQRLEEYSDRPASPDEVEAWFNTEARQILSEILQS
jgi:hypothetical protein